ncbi:MAG: hypothetical protein IKA90_03505 [Clostridia bacterium]|nr:hypothetical protein [Clostridia bacterium]
MKKRSKVVSGIIYALLILALLGGIGFVATFTNGFTDSFKSFYVEYNGQSIMSDTQLMLPCGEELRFDTKYVFEDIGQKGDYKVKIVTNSNSDTTFDYLVDGVPYAYLSDKDITHAFDVKLEDGYFTLTLPQGVTLQSILDKVYEGQEVEIEDSVDERNKCYYAMIVSSYDESVSYRIEFSFNVGVAGIELDKSEVIF